MKIVQQNSNEWSNGLFRPFLNIDKDCIVHIESLSAIFPVNHLREDLYGAFLLGWIHCKKRFNIVLIAEVCEPESVHQLVLSKFDVFDILCSTILEYRKNLKNGFGTKFKI